jgi:hypothetical protein
VRIETYLGRSGTGSPTRGMTGTETVWLELCRIDLPVGKLYLGDPLNAGDWKQGFSTKLPPGRYVVKLKLMEYGAERRVARLRLTVSGTEPDLGRPIGRTWTDTANIGICDTPFLSAFRKDTASALKVVEDSVGEAEPFAFAHLGRAPTARMLIIESGFGDGTYPVYELRHRSKRCGIELVFIKPGDRYPFGEGGHLDYREFLMSLLERCWDDIWAAIRAGPAPAREFFERLSPGRRAFFAIEMLNRSVLPKNCSVELIFTGQEFAVLSDAVANAFSLLHADDYAQRFQQVFALCHQITRLPDREARKAALAGVRAQGGAEVLDAFDEWYRKEMERPDPRMGTYIYQYAESHPDDLKG